MSVRLVADFPSARLRDVVMGKDKTFPRVHAMNLWFDSDFPNKHRDLEAILDNAAEPPRIRYVAAELIGRIDSAASRAILLKSLADKDPSVLEAVITALGYTGGRAELEAIRRIRAAASGVVARRAAMSCVIISYRLGLEGDDLKPSPESDFIPLLAGAARPIQIEPADPEDAAACLRNLRWQPLAIEYDERAVHTIRCGKIVSRLLLNREFSIGHQFSKLAERKALLGVLAGRNDSTRVDFLSALMFSAPSQPRGTIDLFILKNSGTRVFSGRGTIENDAINFQLRAVTRPGGFAATIPGELQAGGRMKFTEATGSLFVQERRAPEKGSGRAN